MRYRNLLLTAMFAVGVVMLAAQFRGIVIPEHALPYLSALALALVAGYSATFTACAGAAEALGKGLGEGAAEVSGPDKKKTDEAVEELRRKIHDVPTEDLKKVLDQVKRELDETEPDVKKVSRAAGKVADLVSDIVDWVRKFKATIDKYEDDLEKFVAICIYMARRLEAELGAKLAELVLYLMYLFFYARLQGIINRLMRKYWWLRFLRTLLR